MFRRRITAAAVASALSAVPIQMEAIPFNGGLDLITPPLSMAPGSCRAAQNFEQDINGGYVRCKGYERFSGKTSPSSAGYWRISATITGSFANGDTVTGATSGATGICLTSTSSSVILTAVSGTFQNGENLQVLGVTQAVSTSTANADSASTALLHAQYRNMAADYYRSLIAAIPGTGRVLGVVRFDGVTYGVRNAVGGLSAAIYKSTGSGWSLVSLGYELDFTTGTEEIAEGVTVTGQTSAATGVVSRVVRQDGSYSAGTAEGRLILSSVSGTFQSSENLQVGGITKAVAGGAQAAITLLPSGRYEFVIENFGGAVATRRIYGCDGVNRGFEFDGTVFVPIETGMTTDAPDHVAAHKTHLFFSFGASVQHSATGEPYVWNAQLGASEIATGDDVTGFMPQPGSEAVGAMAMFTRNRTHILYGTSVADWNNVTYRSELGAYEHSIQDVGLTMFLDDQGVMSLRAAQEFGNFGHAALTNRIRRWINAQRTKVTASCISRDKSQYRLFFSDGYALYVTMAGSKVIGMMPQLLPDPVRCIWSAEESDGSERIFFGSDDGFVYEMEKGTSFDGDNIEAYLHLAFNFSRSPRINKRYRRCALEVIGTSYASFTFSHEIGYASLNIPQGEDQSVVTSFSTAQWDSFTWDAFYWDGKTLMPAEVPLVGTGVNMSVMIRTSSDYQEPVRFSGALVHYTPRRLVRGIA